MRRWLVIQLIVLHIIGISLALDLQGFLGVKPEQSKQIRVQVQKLHTEEQHEEIINEIEQSRRWSQDGEMLMMSASAEQKYKIFMKNHRNNQYMGTIYLGEQMQPYNIIFDTGSEWMWLADNKCEECPEQIQRFNCNEQRQYCSIQKQKKQLKYGKGFVSGYQAILSLSFDQQTVINGLRTLLSQNIQELNTFRADGLMGLGLSKSDQLKSYSILDVLKSGDYINKRIFSLYLSDAQRENSISQQQQKSVLIFGGYDPQMADGDVIWHQIVNTQGWFITLDSFKLGQYTIDSTAEQSLIDSGSSLLIMGNNELSQIIQILTTKYDAECELQGSYYCSGNYRRWPSLSFIINGIDYKLTSDMYVGPQGKIMIAGRAYASGFVILGDVFMRNYYCVFDSDDQQIGIVKVKTNQRQIGWLDN